MWKLIETYKGASSKFTNLTLIQKPTTNWTRSLEAFFNFFFFYGSLPSSDLIVSLKAVFID